MKECKYYNKHLDTIREYVSCLYKLDGCCTGGLLHIVLDDGNLDDDDIKWCLDRCIENPEEEESGIGKLICEELLKLPMEQRRLVYESDWVVDAHCFPKNCEDCPIENESFW